MATVTSALSTVRYDLSRALIITRRELRDMSRDWRIIIPILILTLIFPPLMNITAGATTRFAERYGALIVGQRLIPFLLMIVGFFPISVSLVIALETFVGEKERRSLEPLLNTPMTNLQLYIGKALAATVPPLAASYLGIAVYLTGLYFTLDWLPSFNLLAIILMLTTSQATVMVAGAVVVSSQTTSVRAANLLASFIIVPMAFLVQAEALIMFWARYNILWVIVGGLLVLNAILIRMGVRIFNREELLGSEIDELNIKGSLKLFWSYVKGEDSGQKEQAAGGRARRVRSVWRWYRYEVVGGSLWRTLLPAAFVLLALIGGGLLGVQQAKVWPIPAEAFIQDDWAERFANAMSTLGLQGTNGVVMVLWQNIRVLVIASVLGVFSLGVLAIIIALLPMAIIGYLGSNVYTSGLATLPFWMAIVPHGILEIPAIALAAAAILRLGASVMSPPAGKTLSEGWLFALADAFKLWVGVILPLLVASAFLEIYVTPAVVLAVAAR